MTDFKDQDPNMAALQDVRRGIQRQIIKLTSSANTDMLHKLAATLEDLVKEEEVPGDEATELELFDFIMCVLNGDNLASQEDQGMAHLLLFNDLIEKLQQPSDEAESVVQAETVSVEPFMKPEEAVVRTPVPLPMRVAIVLYKLGRCGEYCLVANQFGVHKSTVKKFVYMFCCGMVDRIIGQFIKVPSQEEAFQIAERFQRAYGLPQVIGCIDGSHIPILPPTDGYRDFINRKGWASYVLQGVVDDQYWELWKLMVRV
ncbi:hypothetical protein ABVT39_019385 [Epinephelus coioides]